MEGKSQAKGAGRSTGDAEEAASRDQEGSGLRSRPLQDRGCFCWDGVPFRQQCHLCRGGPAIWSRSRPAKESQSIQYGDGWLLRMGGKRLPGDVREDSQPCLSKTGAERIRSVLVWHDVAPRGYYYPSQGRVRRPGYPIYLEQRRRRPDSEPRHDIWQLLRALLLGSKGTA